MRLLFVSSYPPERDGIGAYCAFMRGELVAQGHEVAVIAARASVGAPDEVIGSLPSLAGIGFPALLRSVRAFAPDLVHVQFAVATYGGLLPSLVRVIDRLRREGLSVVITMHEVTRDTESLRAAGRALYRTMARRADQIIVHTEAARRALDGQLGGRQVPVQVIAHPRAELPPAGIDADELRRRLRLRDDRVVLAFGFIDVDKGLGDLFAAAALLSAAGKLGGIRVVVAGAVRRRFGALRVFELRDILHLRRLKRAVVRHGLAGQVLFVGFVPGREVRAWFELATISVLPYRRSEQSGVASLASAAGSPLLTTRVGELAAFSTAAPVAPRDPAALAAALERFLLASGDRPVHPAVGGDLAEIVDQTGSVYRRLTHDIQPAAVLR